MTAVKKYALVCQLLTNFQCKFTYECCGSGICAWFLGSTYGICYNSNVTPRTTSTTSPVEKLTTAPTTERRTLSTTESTVDMDKCLRPGRRCTETNKCCLWTCQLYRQDELNGENYGVCPIPMVPWPPFDDDASPGNANDGSNSSPDHENLYDYY
uniref:Uncharacterized protein n=1 Tax=Graphocephala atropunctata TaxID=36148 RepID=A0A1B6M179_9HEMI